MSQVIIPWYCFLLYKEVTIMYKSCQIISSKLTIYDSELQGANLYLQAHLFLKSLLRNIGNWAEDKKKW